MSAVRMWLEVDWDAPEPAVRAIEAFARSVRAVDPVELAIPAGPLAPEAAGERLMALLRADEAMAGRVERLPSLAVVPGEVPADVEAHLRLPGPGEAGLHVLREELAPYVALTPILNQAEWARTWQPEAGFRHLIVDNASDDDTAQILADRGADVIVGDGRVGRVESWRRALALFLEATDATWMKWVFAGDRLLPGAADLLDRAIAAAPDVRVISAQYQWKQPDGGLTRFQPMRENRLVAPREALHRFVVQGNWMGGPMAIALHRDVIEELEFGGHAWVADWQASMSLARRYPVLHLNDVIGVFDASRARHHSAHAKDVSTIVQDAAMRYQALGLLRESGAGDELPLDELEAKIDAWIMGEVVRRGTAAGDAAAAPAGARVKLDTGAAGGAARLRIGAGRGSVVARS